MPSAIVQDLVNRVIEMEKKVAVLMSWHKVNTGLLLAVFAACVGLMFKK